jgi:hypothetical protein
MRQLSSGLRSTRSPPQMLRAQSSTFQELNVRIFFFFVESINACAFGRAPRGHFYLFMCRELTIYLCLASLPGVVTNDIIETARNRAHVLRDTRE